VRSLAFLPGALALALLLALTLGSVLVVWAWAGASGGLGPADWRALEFTLRQAFISAAISTVLGAFLARALSRRRFPGRELAIALLGAPFLLPVIVAILGLLAIWGRAGLVSAAGLSLGLGRVDIYGLPGVLLAHVFFNLPLAARFFLQGYAAIPAEQWRLAAQLGLLRRALFRHLEAPMFREVAPGAFVLIFLLCATSFAVALALGGGPRATTLELAIYQALRFDFDLGRAALLAMLQFGVCAALAVGAAAVSAPSAADPGLGATPRLWRGAEGLAFDRFLLIAALLFLGAPLLAVLARGAPGLAEAAATPQLWPAFLRSLAVALMAAAISMAMALSIGFLIIGAHPGVARMMETAGLLALVAPPFVVGLALFMTLRAVADPFAFALPATALVNALMSLPFALRLTLPALRRAQAEYGRLADQLGLAGRARFRHAVWPTLRRPARFAAGLAAALSAGDLGVIALFARPDEPTLPLLMHRLMAGYRMEAAGGVALILLALSFGLFVVIDRLGPTRADA
jgi:thiamine transport system permease protein